MRILKRKKGRTEYFYLQHSFRNNSDIITKEKYLGKKIPDNIEEIKQELKKEEQEILYRKLEKIKENFQKEWIKYPESVKKIEKEEIAIAFTYNTNALEGSTITLEETREVVQTKTAPNKSLGDIKETEAHFKVFLESIIKKERMSIFLLLKWHKRIFQETKEDIAGKFREYPIRVGNYTAPDWQDVKKLMEGFIRFVNQTKINPVELAFRAHYKFEKIHPFGDGNGRIGRLIMNYILWHNKYPMFILEHKRRKSYYKSLQKDEGGFVNYLFRRYFNMHKKRYLNEK